MEDAGSVAVEVLITWGGNVLHTAHLSPGRSFYLGEEESKNLRCDFLVPAERLGATRAPLVQVSGGVSYAVILPGSTGTIDIGGRSISVADAVATNVVEPCVEMSGAHRIALHLGTRVRLTFGDFGFSTSAVPAGKRIKRSLFGAASLTALSMVGMSFLAHAMLLGGMAFFKPSLDAGDDDETRKERDVLMQQLLHASAEKEPEAKPEEKSDSAGPSGGSGKEASGEAGSMGKQDSRKTDGRVAIKGPKDNKEPNMSREALRAEAETFGMISALHGMGDPAAIKSPWAALAQGKDDVSANGAMWGSTLDDNAGAGGLTLSGIGDGGGSKYPGFYGLGSVGTIGGGKGGTGDQGFGQSHGKNLPDHVVKPIIMPRGVTVVSGKIPGEVIQRIVRQSFGRFRVCYEAGLRNNPALSGRVAVRFAIDRHGAVANASNGGSDLPDSTVVSCIVRSFSGLSFPEPEGGLVTVVYPIRFTPGGLGRAFGRASTTPLALC